MDVVVDDEITMMRMAKARGPAGLYGRGRCTKRGSGHRPVTGSDFEVTAGQMLLWELLR